MGGRHDSSHDYGKQVVPKNTANSNHKLDPSRLCKTNYTITCILGFITLNWYKTCQILLSITNQCHQSSVGYKKKLQPNVIFKLIFGNALANGSRR